MESIWTKTEKKLLENGKKLSEKLESEICVIGGGITGISIGYYLSKAGKNVIIIDRTKLASGTTGNTTGKITSQHGLFYKYLIDNYGKKYAKDYYKANQEAIENIANIIKEENIDCDFERQNAYVFTRSKQEISKIKDEVNAVKEIGGEAEFTENIDVPVKNVLRSNKVFKSSNVQCTKISKRISK